MCREQLLHRLNVNSAFPFMCYLCNRGDGDGTLFQKLLESNYWFTWVVVAGDGYFVFLFTLDEHWVVSHFCLTGR
jgi:hypothetical protein